MKGQLIAVVTGQENLDDHDGHELHGGHEESRSLLEAHVHQSIGTEADDEGTEDHLG